MAVALAPRLTLEEFLALPERKPALEFVEGRVSQKVSPNARHSGVQSDLVQLFDGALRRRKIARAFPELRTTFGGRSYVPDVAVFRWERIARDPDGRLADDVFAPPDVAVEIISPRQRILRLLDRCRWYVANGVRVALLVDPRRETVTLFRPKQPPVECRSGDVIDLEDVLPGFRLDVATVFAALTVD